MGNDCITEANDPLAAIRSYDKALQLYPDYVEALVMKGKALASLNEITNALAALNDAVAMAPLSFLAHSTLGQILQKFGYNEEAIESYRHADKIDPQNRSNLKHLIHLCEEMDEDEEAEHYRIRLRNLRKK